MIIKIDFSELKNFGERLANISVFEKEMLSAAEQIAEKLRQLVKSKTPIYTGRLKNGWNTRFIIKKKRNGYRVTFINYVPYAASVNYGHPSHNQYNKGGQPYLVKKRVKVPAANALASGAQKSSHWVWGHFFVEESVILLANSEIVKNIILNSLRKWWG